MYPVSVNNILPSETSRTHSRPGLVKDLWNVTNVFFDKRKFTDRGLRSLRTKIELVEQHFVRYDRWQIGLLGLVYFFVRLQLWIRTSRSTNLNKSAYRITTKQFLYCFNKAIQIHVDACAVINNTDKCSLCVVFTFLEEEKEEDDDDDDGDDDERKNPAPLRTASF